MAVTDTPWSGQKGGDEAFFVTSGQFTSTIKTSYTMSPYKALSGIGWDGTNTPYCGENPSDVLYLQSGQFTSTVKTSVNVNAIDFQPQSVTSTIDLDTPWIGNQANKYYTTSGQFTSTLKTSLTVPSGTNPSGIETGTVDALYCDGATNKLFHTSGQYTSTIKDSEAWSGHDTQTQDISWDGTNTYAIGRSTDRMFLISGRITSTVKDSQSVSAQSPSPSGICVNDVDSRAGLPPDVTVLPAALTLALAAVTPESVTHYVTVLPSTLTMALAEKIVAIEIPLNPIVYPDALTISAAQPAPTVYLVQVIAETLTMGLALPTPNIATSSTTYFPDEQTLALALPAPTIVTTTAAFVGTLPMMTLSAESYHRMYVEATLLVPQLSATLVNGDVFSFAKPLPMFSIDVKMGMKAEPAMPMLTLSSTLTQSNGCTFTKPLPMMTLSATGTVRGSITFDKELPMITIDVDFKVGGLHTFASNFPLMTLSANGYTGSTGGIFSGSIPLISLASSGYNSGNVSFAKSLPIVTLDAYLTSYQNRII